MPLALRMTRPTDCTTSTSELRGDRKSTASRAGTSTPSDRHRAFDRTRHSFSGTGALSQASCSERANAFIVPST